MRGKNKINENEHCCPLISTFIKDPRISIYYSKRFREYSIETTSGAYQMVDYCPFCGTKLPSRLRDKLFDILEDQYGIDSPFDNRQTTKIPEEFNTDEWWKKRNL